MRKGEELCLCTREAFADAAARVLLTMFSTQLFEELAKEGDSDDGVSEET